MEHYDLPNSLAPILPFIDDASNWYVRRSRRRFWKSDDDGDKKSAYRTLHYVLVQLAHVMAPFTPFLAEELYQKLTGGESVHLQDWPEVGHPNETVLQSMADIRQGIEQGLSQRAAAKLKVRQPLKHAKIYVSGQITEAEMPFYAQVISEELNVKKVVLEMTPTLHQPGSNKVTELDLKLTPELRREGMMREVVRHVQNERKKAGLQVNDRIRLSLSTTDDELRKAISEHLDTISAETLATDVTFDRTLSYEASCAVDDAPFTVAFEKS
jgi:isoleucyl-tRNA synthetase